jgi:hypothetical protein
MRPTKKQLIELISDDDMSMGEMAEEILRLFPEAAPAVAPQCGDDEAGYLCNRPAGHDGDHWNENQYGWRTVWPSRAPSGAPQLCEKCGEEWRHHSPHADGCRELGAPQRDALREAALAVRPKQGPSKAVFYGGNTREHLNPEVVLLLASDFELLRAALSLQRATKEQEIIGWLIEKRILVNPETWVLHEVRNAVPEDWLREQYPQRWWRLTPLVKLAAPEGPPAAWPKAPNLTVPQIDHSEGALNGEGAPNPSETPNGSEGPPAGQRERGALCNLVQAVDLYFAHMTPSRDNEGESNYDADSALRLAAEEARALSSSPAGREVGE